MIASLLTNLRFELTSRKRLLGPYMYWMIMFALAALVVLASGGAFKGANVSFGLGPKVFVNGPFALNLHYAVLMFFGLLIISPIYGQAICKDYEAKFDQIVLATPAHRTGFYLGRYLGATLVSTLIFTSLAVGQYLVAVSPFVQKSLFTTNSLLAYVLPYFTLIIPNIIIFGSIAFAVGAITKRMSAVYVAGILCFMGYLFAQGFTSDIERKTVRALVDPFGMNAISVFTQYWSVTDKSEKLVTLSGVFLWNRVAWLSVSLGFLILALCFVQKAPKPRSAKKSKGEARAKAEARLPLKVMTTLTSALDFSFQARWRLFFAQVRFEVRSSLKNVYFLCLTLAGVIYMFVLSGQLGGKVFGTETYPVTYNVLAITTGTFTLFLLIIMTFYTGELLWRERQSRMNQMIDSMPVPVWLVGMAKFAAMQVIILVLLAVVALCGVIIQAAKGYTHFELGQVFTTLFVIQYLDFLLLSALMFALHSVVNNKYVGHGLVILFLIVQNFMASMGLEHTLYRFGSGITDFQYSDMNGYGPFLARIGVFRVYWGLAALLLLVCVYLFWQRGTDSMGSRRWQEAKKRLTTPLRALVALLLIGFIAQGSYIFYNTNRVNEYETEKSRDQDRFDFETKYKAGYDGKPQLKITAVNADVDIFPSKLCLKGHVRFVLENKTGGPVDEIFIVAPLRKQFFKLSFDRPVETVVDDVPLKISVYRFQTPVQPGEIVHADYVVDYGYEGVTNGSPDTAIAGNGTFFNNASFFPRFSYDPRGELSLDKTREQYGLKPKLRMPLITDEKARQQNYVTGGEADWIEFETTVSTDADQIAIAPGYLQKDWTENGRHYFHYKMDQKILNFYSFLSARYEVKRDKWNDVNIEIYYNKGHEYNLDAMIAATKDGLSYFSEAFGPYQHHQFRILEFPRYQSFAQSFPNTIPYSESIGFIAKVDPKDEKDLNYPYFVTAHELAHQWWAHQVISGNVQGATALSETMAEYSALLIMEKKYGRDKMERFLKYEMEGYLRGRSSESKIERPVALNENQQYIHYNKGGLVMFALKEVVGEKPLNAAIRKFVEKVKYQNPPFTTSFEFIATLKENLDPKFYGVIDDLLLKITLYDNRILEHSMRAEADGTYTIDLDIQGGKVYVDDKGAEQDVAMLEPFEITVKGEDKATFFTHTYPIRSGLNHLTINVPHKPATLWLDGIGIWIDKNRDDNKVTF